MYLLKLINKDAVAHEYTLIAEGIPGLELRSETAPIAVASGSVRSLAVALRAEESALAGRSILVRFILTARDRPDIAARADAKFLGPSP